MQRVQWAQNSESLQSKIQLLTQFRHSQQPKNVKIITLKPKVKKRSQSLPNSIDCFDKITQPKLLKKPTLMTQSSIGSPKILRQSKISTLTDFEIKPIKVKQDQNTVTRRRSCHCSECGILSKFQMNTIHYQQTISQIERDRLSPLQRFSKQIRKQQTLILAPYLLGREIAGDLSDSPLKSEPSMNFLEIITQEPNLSTSRLIDRTPSKKPSYFESFIQKQKALVHSQIKSEKNKSKKFHSITYHFKSFNKFRDTKNQKFIPLIPLKPFKKDSIQISDRCSTKKSEHSIQEIYCMKIPKIQQQKVMVSHQQIKNIQIPQKQRLLTLPEIHIFKF